MDLRLVDYLTYLLASVVLTVWVGRTLFTNGRAFLVSVFKEEGLADSVNHLLVVGFYLINFGAVALLINAGGNLASVPDMLQQTVTRLGVVLLILGGMHFFNLLIFAIIRGSRRPRVAQPVNYNPYQPSPEA